MRHEKFAYKPEPRYTATTPSSSTSISKVPAFKKFTLGSSFKMKIPNTKNLIPKRKDKAKGFGSYLIPKNLVR